MNPHEAPSATRNALLFGGAEHPRRAIGALCVERRGAARMANLTSPALALRAAAENAARTQTARARCALRAASRGARQAGSAFLYTQLRVTSSHGSSAAPKPNAGTLGPWQSQRGGECEESQAHSGCAVRQAECREK